MASTVFTNAIDCCCKCHQLLLQMPSTVVGNAIDCSWECHQLLLQMASAVVGNAIDCCKWHRLLLQMASAVVGNVINCYCKWHRLLQMALTIYKRELTNGNKQMQRITQLIVSDVGLLRDHIFLTDLLKLKYKQSAKDTGHATWAFKAGVARVSFELRYAMLS